MVLSPPADFWEKWFQHPHLHPPLSQIVDICEDHQKESKLARLLEEIGDGSKILVFVETKRKCDELTRSTIDMTIIVKHVNYINMMMENILLSLL